MGRHFARNGVAGVGGGGVGGRCAIKMNDAASDGVGVGVRVQTHQ